jgi:hypothetical protein
MRKFYSTAVLAILLSVLSSPVIAAVEDCEVLKGDGGTRGLYGMCVAYWNAEANQNKNGSQLRSSGGNNRFLDRYNEIRDRVGGPEMPGLTQTPVFDCPCWDEKFLADITFESIPEACGENTISFGSDISASHDIAIFDNFSLQLMAGTPFPGLPTSCSVKLTGLPEIFNETTENQTEDCTELLRGLNDVFADAGFDCNGW